MKALLKKIKKLLQNRKFRRLWTRTVSTVAALVVFITTYALVLPAITMEKEAYCGIEAHQHSDECYEDRLICEIPESPGHHHDDSCYTTRQELICTVGEHAHDEKCYDEEGNLICELEEHAHSGECFEEISDLTCGLEESDGHQHDASCYEKVLVCGKEAHTHSEECYRNPEEDLLETAAVATTQAASVSAPSDDDLQGDNTSGEYSEGRGGEDTAELTDPGNANGAEASDAAATLDPAAPQEPAEEAAQGQNPDAYVPELGEVDFETLLNDRTGIYYYHVGEGEVIEDSSQITDWKKVDKDTELGPGDLIRVYIAYTIPAGSLNETNPTAVYTLPANLRLSDGQVKAINEIENGIAAGYVNYDTLELTDPDRYHMYLGAEAVEGTRRPDQDLNDYLNDLKKEGKDPQEFISAVVRVRNVYDTEGRYGEKDAWLGQDLIFTFSPYTIGKNQNTYDASGQPTGAGQKVRGWFTLDFNLGQVDLGESYLDGDRELRTADIVFAAEDKTRNIDEINTRLNVVLAEGLAEEEDEENQENPELNEEGENPDGTAPESVEGEGESGENAAADATGEEAAADATADAAAQDAEADGEKEDAADGRTVVKLNPEEDSDKEKEKTEQDKKEEPEEPLMPAMSFIDSIRVSTGKPAGVEEGTSGSAAASAADALPRKANVTVRVEADEGTFPAGTTMVLSAVDNMDAVAETVRDAVENGGTEGGTSGTGGRSAGKGNNGNGAPGSENKNPRTYGFQAVDISFRDADGNEIEPAKPVRVALTSEIVDQIKKEKEADANTALADPVVVHVDDNGNAETMDLVAPEEVEPAQGKTEEELLQEREAEKAAKEAAEREAAEDDKKKEDESDTTDKAAKENESGNEQEKTDDNSSEMTETIINEEDNGSAEPTEREEPEAVDNTEIIDDSAQVPEESLESENTGEEGDREASGEGTTVSFEADSFSVYAIVYTVDFHWEVEGKTYEFSMPGGGFVSFAKLMELFGVAREEEGDHSGADTGNDIQEEEMQKLSALTLSDVQVSEETKMFVADVEKVEFSDPALVWVGKADNNSTVGAIKRAHNLEVEYSAQLTEEQITEINNQSVESGDWALISLKPFDTEESLTITMKNGDLFVVRVTDARIGNSLDGQSFIIKTLDDTPLAMSSTDPYNYNEKRFFRANEVNGNNDQIWIFEYDGRYDRTYRIKSASTGQYISLDGSHDDGFVLTNNDNDQATLFWIDYNSSTDTYEFSTNSPAHNYNLTVFLNTLYDNNSPRYTMGNQSQRFKLQEAESQEVTALTGDWLLFLDEDEDEIFIRVGETISLRPFDEWTWKEQAVQSDHWNFPGDTNAPTSWTIQSNAANESSKGSWTSSNGVFSFNRHVKYDDQLEVRYWSVQGQAKKVGDYVLANTRNGHEITVHVIPANDEYHKLTPFTGPVPVKVNLFDYDLGKRLDPANNTNTETGIVNQSVNIGHYLHFLSSGNGNGGINKYTKDNNNPNIVASTLDANGYPVLRDSNQSLDYLFDKTQTSWTGGNYNDGMIAYPDVSGLFQQDQDGYYYFNSNSNYAYYDSTSNSMLLYPHTYTQVNKSSKLFNSKPIGFFPFHQYESSNEDHLWVNQNQYLNHHIGMSMEIYYEIPKSRVTEREQNIVYEFSGDDDVWVFVDDELVLDIGGIHQPLGGKIDFTAGKVYVYNASGTATETVSFDVGVHKLSMFYLERGGCDSNLSLKMNMPLILGPGDVELFKSESTTHNGLPDAVFGIWENASCAGEPYAIAVSDGNGVVSKVLPVRVEGQEFYIREILAPQGYTLDDTIYKATAGLYNTTTGRYPFTITALTQEGEMEPATHNVGGKDLPEILNTPAAPIDLSVLKVWQDAAGGEIPAPAGATIEFVLKRTRTFTAGQTYTVRLRNQSRDYDIYDTITAHEGDVLTISYIHNADSGHPIANCQAGNGTGTVVSMTTNDTTSESRVTYTVNPVHASNNIIDIMIPDWFAEWCDPSRHGSGLRVPTFAGVNKAVTEITTEDDEAFNRSNHSITLPTTQGAWSDTFEDLPGQEVVSGILYQYRYYIEEDASGSNIPDGYQTVYTDQTGTHPINESHSQETASTGTQKVINQRLLDIPVSKIWPDYENNHGSTIYTWEADLQLDYRDVPMDGQGQPTRWQEYQPGNEDYQKKLTKANPESSFEGLPMYVYDDNGRQFRREYSVVEKGYKVWENGTLIASHIGNQYTPSDKRYTLWYEHDAGEDSTDLASYYISVYNMHENRDIEEDITIDISKQWKNTEGLTIRPEDEYRAKFRLKRNVLVEYRNHEDETLPKSEWVTVNLVTDSDPDHNKTLVVPPGTPMYIRGNLKAGASPTNIKFTRSDTGEQLTAVADDEFSEHGYDLFMVTFDAPTAHGSVVNINMDEYSDSSVVGGANGFILSDSGDRQFFGTDETFLKEFELSNEKGWSKHFPDTTGSESEVDDLLPVVEVSELDAEGKTANTYIYTYYFEEVECVPSDFYATFTDSTGNALGDANHQMYTDSVINATNRLKPGSIRIKKNVKVNGENIGESDPNTQFVDGIYTFRIEGVPETDTANVPPRTVTLTISGGQSNTIEVKDLAPGQYKVFEEAPKNGTSLVGENGITVEVVKDVIGTDAPLVEMTNNMELTELTVNKEWAASSPADHPVDVTFKLYRVGYFMDEEEQRPASEGYYPDGNTIYTVHGSGETSVPNLPVHGVESVAGIDRFVTYEYRVVEMPASGDTAYWPSYSTEGTTTTITNTPVETPDHETDVGVSKSWLDKDGNSVAALHENDEIEFALKEIPHETGYVPVHLVYINANNTTWKQEEVFVKKNEKLNFEFRKGGTTFNHQIEITEGNNHTTTGGRGTQYGYESAAITDETTITLRQTFSISLLFSTYYDRWGDTVEDLGLAYQWTSTVTATDGTLYTDYETFYNAMKALQGGEANELYYLLSKDEIAGQENTYEGRITGDWTAIFDHLPEFQKVGDEFIIMTYEITELKIKPYGKDEEPVGSTTVEGYQGETTNYLVNWEQNAGTWTITNREKPGADIIIRKTDAEERPLAGAVFEISKQDGSVFVKLTHDKYEWLDSNDQFTVPEDGITLSGLKDGFYQIREVGAPDGYVILSDIPVEFEIRHSVVFEDSNVLSDGVTHIPASGEDKDAFVIPNTPGAALPSTGGFGTRWIYLTGAVLALLAGAGLLRRKRRLID